MVKIVYAHPTSHFKNLRIAGDFTDWKIIPMVKRPENAAGDESWEVSVDTKSLPNYIKKIHFKFIDDNGVWFTDEDYAKDIDEHSNENNVIVLPENSDLRTTEDEFEKECSIKVEDDGPKSPVPSLKDTSVVAPKQPAKFEEEAPEEENLEEEEEEDSLGERAIVVNHSDAEETKSPPDDDKAPKSSGTLYSNQGPDPEQYKTVLARIIAFFTNLFRNWFG